MSSIRNRARNITDDALRILEGRLKDMDDETLIKVINAVRPIAVRGLAPKPAAPAPPPEAPKQIILNLGDGRTVVSQQPDDASAE